ncbi:hypothetical protein Tco_0311366 [Tanacetum coccineum]
MKQKMMSLPRRLEGLHSEKTNEDESEASKDADPISGTDISQKDEKTPSKKRLNLTRDGKVCEDEAQSKSSQIREEKAKKNIT